MISKVVTCSPAHVSERLAELQLTGDRRVVLTDHSNVNLWTPIGLSVVHLGRIDRPQPKGK